MKLKIITYATHSEGYYEILIKHMIKLKLDYKVIGFGTKWIGFYQRIIDVYNYLKIQDKNKIILFTDGFDSIVLESEKTILNKYKKFGKKIVFGIPDIQNNLKKTFQNLVFRNGKRDTIINAGCYIGKNKYLIKMFKMIINKYGKNSILDDQIVLNNFFNDNEDFFNKYIGLDIDKLIFANMSNNNSLNYFFGIDESNYKVNTQKNKIINIDNNISPSIISGCGNFDMSIYVDFLGYGRNLIIPRNYNSFMLNNIKNYITTHILLNK